MPFPPKVEEIVRGPPPPLEPEVGVRDGADRVALEAGGAEPLLAALDLSGGEGYRVGQRCGVLRAHGGQRAGREQHDGERAGDAPRRHARGRTVPGRCVVGVVGSREGRHRRRKLGPGLNACNPPHVGRAGASVHCAPPVTGGIFARPLTDDLA